jgi:hypothetical protein
MANLASPFTTYSDTTPQKKVITDYITLIDPSDAPLVEALGGLDGAAGKFKFVNKGTNPQWLEDTLTPLTSTMTSSTDHTTSDTTAILVSDPNVFQEGHIVLVDSEQMWVSAVNGSTSALTVTRDYGGTQATHASGSTVTIIGMARLEGDDSDDIGFTDRTVGSNYTQIFHQEIKVSETQRVIDQWGIGDEFDYQAKKAIPSLMRLIEKQLFYGTVKAGSASTPRAFGGLETYITDNKQDYGASLLQSHFENAVMSAYTDGGTGPWIAACYPTHLQTIKGFYDSSAFLRVDPSQSQVGMVVDEIITPFGNVKLLLDRWAKSTTIPIIDPQHAGLLTLRPFTQEPLAKTGDSVKGEVVGEFTFCLRQDKAHALITT